MSFVGSVSIPSDGVGAQEEPLDIGSDEEWDGNASSDRSSFGASSNGSDGEGTSPKSAGASVSVVRTLIIELAPEVVASPPQAPVLEEKRLSLGARRIPARRLSAPGAINDDQGAAALGANLPQVLGPGAGLQPEQLNRPALLPELPDEGVRRTNCAGAQAAQHRPSVVEAVKGQGYERLRRQSMPVLPMVLTAFTHMTQETVKGESSGSDWAARLQCDEEIMERRRSCVRRQLDLLEAAVPAIVQMPPKDRLQLQNKLSREIEGVLSVMAQRTFETIRSDWDELQHVKKELTDLEEKTGSMNATYLKEITVNRDQRRSAAFDAQEAMAAIEPENGEMVAFYEPLQFLSAELRSLTLSVVDEKLKAIFNHDPLLKERSESSQLARHEAQMQDEKLSSFASLNSKLRSEVRDLQQRLADSAAVLEKVHGQCDSLQMDLQREITSLEVARAQLQTMTKKEEARCLALQFRSEVAVNTESNCKPNVQINSVSAGISIETSSPMPVRRVSRSSIKPEQSVEQCLTVIAHLSETQSRLNVVECEKAYLKDEFQAGEKKLQDAMDRATAASELAAGSELALADARSRCAAREKETADFKAKYAELEDASASAKQWAESSRIELKVASASIEELTSSSKSLRETVQRLERRLRDGKSQADTAQKKLQEELVCLKSQAARADLEQNSVTSLQREMHLVRSIAAIPEEKHTGVLRDSRPTLKGDIKLTAEVQKQTEACKAAHRHAEELVSCLNIALAKNSSLEVAVKAAQDTVREFQKEAESMSACRAQLQHQNIEVDTVRRKNAKLSSKISIARAQVHQVVGENQALHLSMQERQRVIEDLSSKICEIVPGSSASSDIVEVEVLISRMQAVVKQGGGAYLRLHKDAQLRDLANLMKKQPLPRHIQSSEFRQRGLSDCKFSCDEDSSATESDLCTTFAEEAFGTCGDGSGDRKGGALPDQPVLDKTASLTRRVMLAEQLCKLPSSALAVAAPPLKPGSAGPFMKEVDHPVSPRCYWGGINAVVPMELAELRSMPPLLRQSTNLRGAVTLSALQDVSVPQEMFSDAEGSPASPSRTVCTPRGAGGGRSIGALGSSKVSGRLSMGPPDEYSSSRKFSRPSRRLLDARDGSDGSTKVVRRGNLIVGKGGGMILAGGSILDAGFISEADRR